MITPSFGLTATERVLPRLALDFTTAILDPRVTFTRSGNTATVTNSSGVIVGVNADIPRFDYNPTTLLCNGLLIEESRTNVLLNSLLNGTSLATQTVVVTAAARTLSFYGTGQIVLSGAASATVTGTGAYPTRTTLTFTPSAGALILTVTGTVQFAQLELGSFATSFIPTTASQVTRTADVATMTGTNFSSWFNASEGSFVARFFSYVGASVNNPRILAVSDGSTANRLRAFLATTNTSTQVSSGGVTQASLSNTPSTLYGVFNKIAFGYKVNNFVASVNGGSTSSDLSGSVPVAPIRLNICADFDSSSQSQLNGYIALLNYYPQSLTFAEIQSFSK